MALMLVASLLVPAPEAAVAAGRVDLPVLQRERAAVGKPVAARPFKKAATPAWRAPRIEWPAKGSAEVALKAVTAGEPQAAATGRVAVGQLPVRVGPVQRQARAAAGVTAPGRVRVTVKDRAITSRAGVDGVLVGVERTDGSARAGRVSIELDYSKFRFAFGGDWASRLRLVQVPGCAVTTPEKAACRVRKPVATRNDVERGTLVGEVDAAPAAAGGSASEPMLVAAAAGASGESGSYAATSLSPSGSWSAGSSSGDFSWSYPLDLPPSPGGPAPQVGLGYSSGSVDGRMASTNNQSSWVGEGWDYWPGYIERRYKPCVDDMAGGNNTVKTGDLCWAAQNLTMSLGGRTTELVRDDATGAWQPASDDGSRVDRFTGAVNGDKDGEYWRVTTTDGTQYFFGRHRVAGVQSVWTLPVFGNQPGEPCHAATFAASSCDQAWRWNLDYVVDPLGNSMSLFYAKEINRYGRNLQTKATPYVRGGYLTRIEYGHRAGAETASAPARVVFGVAERCIPVVAPAPNPFDCAEAEFTKANAARWPDTPVDQNCAATEACTDRFSPTFWSRKRLTTITTEVLVGNTGSTYRPVDTWSLTQSFPPSGENSTPSLWLDSITRTGKVGGSLASPPVRFFGEQMDNRVDGLEGVSAFVRRRINTIQTETGGTIGVTYSQRECSAVAPVRMPAAPDRNTMRCYPVFWQPDGETKPKIDWFHKYVAEKVVEQDRTAGQPPKETNYRFVGSPAWGFDDNEYAKPEHRTWSQYRGYGKVETRVGLAPDPISLVVTQYFRGMDGDRLADGSRRDVKLTDSDGGVVEDRREYQGMARETLYYDRDGGKLVSATLNTPWIHGPTASRARAGLDPQRAYVVQTSRVASKSLLSNGSWRRTAVEHSFNAEGIATHTSDLGDLADSGDDSCARFEYGRNTTAWLLTMPSRTEKVAVACSKTPTRPADVVSDVRMYYDGSTTLGAAPAKGNVTRVDELVDWPAGGSARFATTSRSAFDAYGRTTETYDVYGKKTTTAYSPASNGQVTQVTTTNPLNHVSTMRLEPAWGVQTSTTDANGRQTDLEYDALGRLRKVWLPDHTKAEFPTAPNSEFLYQVAVDKPVVVTTKSLKDDGTYRTGYEIYDGLMRMRQTQQPAAGTQGGRILTDVYYDSRGLTWKKNAAHYEASAPSGVLVQVGDHLVPSQMVYTYDPMGRPLAEIFYSHGNEKWRTTTGYGGEFTTTDPPAGGTATTVIKDGAGRTVELRQHHNGAPSGAYDATKYAYDRFGRPSSVTDPAGNNWTYHYDLRGRTVRTEDPDKGTSTMTYDDGDRLVSTTDSRGKTIAVSYDDLGRKTSVRDGSPSGPKRAEWTYDTLPNGTSVKGLGVSSTRYVGSNAYTSAVTGYDAAYRPTGTTVTVPANEGKLAGTYAFGATYTETGLPSTSTFPQAGGLAQETVSYGYDGLGMAVAVRGPGGLNKYLASTTYSPYGEPLRQELGAAGKSIWLTNYYQEGTRRLAQVKVDRQTAPTRLDDISYTYDAIGNIKKITGVEDNSSTDTQCFDYDYLRRMTQAWTATDDCAAAPSASTVGGPQAYWHSFAFDKVGNRTKEVQHDPTGDASKDVTREYSYPAATGPQPHTLSSVKQTGPGGSRLDEFSYDPSGNTTRRKVGGAEQSMEWDAEGHLAKVTNGTEVSEFLYDADGNRLIRRDPGATTLYLGAMELKLTKSGDAVSGTRYIAAGAATAVRTSDGQVNYLLADHHGTAQESINASTQATTRRTFTPYGQVRGVDPTSWPGEKGFVGGTVDESTGLTHLGAREYDADTGRFISVDPIMDSSDPQQIHGYAYANNSPVTFTDPSGLKFCEDSCAAGEAYVDSSGKFHPRTKKTSPPAQGKRDNSGPSDEDVKRAKRVQKKKLLDVVIEHGGKILMEVLGINDIRDCVMNGDIGACVMAVVGALPWGKILKAKKIGQALWKAGKAVLSWMDEMKWAKSVLRRADDAAAAAAKQGDEAVTTAAKQGDDAGGAAAKQGDAGASCPTHSFSPDTEVLMADGSTKPIKDVQLGDEVLATDPETGKTVARKVTRLHRNQDTDLTDVTIQDAHGNVSTINTTQHHPFWDNADNEWVDASELVAGDKLRTPEAGIVTVVKVRSFAGTQTMLDLTVEDIHTYHVLAGNTPVLVHNCGDGYKGVREASKMMQEAGVPREFRKQVIDSFESGTIRVQTAPNNFYAMRFFDNVNAQARGRYLTQDFPATRGELALRSNWNQMTGMAQFQIRPGARIITGRVSGQGLGYPGGGTQIYVLDPRKGMDLL